MKRRARKSPAEGAELRELRARLEEAEGTIEAIRSGRVDALVVYAEEGERVFTLKGADHRYRRLVETMNEGAAMLAPDGVVLYCNTRFAEMLGSPLDAVLGRTLDAHIRASSRAAIE